MPSEAAIAASAFISSSITQEAVSLTRINREWGGQREEASRRWMGGMGIMGIM
jgi:hypothetical protein